MSQTTSPPYSERSDAHPDGAAPGGTPTPRRPILLMVALAVAVAVIVALVAVIVWPDGSDDVTTEPATTTTERPATTGTTAPSTTAAPLTVAPVDTSTAVFPSGTGDVRVRYFDPVAAAKAFALEFVGFTDPQVGEFMQGDARSGEVQVRPAVDGPVTTVFVRQLGTDGSWWVLGAATDHIAVDAPGQGDAIASPVTVSGSAWAFEGAVVVEVREDGAREPLGSGYVTGGGDEMRPFSGQVSFSPASTDYGAMVFLTQSARYGEIWEAAVYRVRFS